MKLNLTIMWFWCLTVSVVAQKYEHQAEFEDGTIIDYSLLENNPYMKPNMTLQIGAELGSQPPVSLLVGGIATVQYRIPKLMELEGFLFFGTSYGVAGSKNSISDNPEALVNGRLGIAGSIDLANAIRRKPIKHILKRGTSYDAFRRMINTKYKVRMPTVVNHKYSVDGGYTFYTNPVTSSYAISDKGELVLSNADNRIVHTTMHTHMVHIGFSYARSFFLKLKTRQHLADSPYKQEYSKTGLFKVYVHFLYGFFNIEPVYFSTSRVMSSNTVNAGSYNLYHDGAGGFRTEALGGRIGITGRIYNIFNLTSVYYKIEGGILPSLSGTRALGNAIFDHDRLILMFTLGADIPISAKRYTKRYRLGFR